MVSEIEEQFGKEPDLGRLYVLALKAHLKDLEFESNDLKKVGWTILVLLLVSWILGLGLYLASLFLLVIGISAISVSNRRKNEAEKIDKEINWARETLGLDIDSEDER